MKNVNYNNKVKLKRKRYQYITFLTSVISETRKSSFSINPYFSILLLIQSAKKINLLSVNIPCTEENIKSYFSELKTAVAYLETNEAPDYSNKDLFPIL